MNSFTPYKRAFAGNLKVILEGFHADNRNFC